ncbi:Uncharacterised protein [Candidatus Gugararchaeum adminiculabundum]|nr:Uncharacterised protein [Candidatus Gugararchaeum adminiculabundum]
MGMNAAFCVNHRLESRSTMRIAGTVMAKDFLDPTMNAANSMSGITIPERSVNGSGANGASMSTCKIAIMFQWSSTSKKITARTST